MKPAPDKSSSGGVRAHQAMILAAGRGVRMKALVQDTPKPLLKVGGKPLIEHHVRRLAEAGIQRLVINHGRLGERIEQALETGNRYGVRIHYSPEGTTPLETAGGIIRALGEGLLDDEEPFLLVNADVYTDFDFSRLRLPAGTLAHLVLVDNPEHHPKGDFCLRAGRLCENDGPRYTYSGIGIYHPQIFANAEPGTQALRPTLDALIARQALSGEHFRSLWVDVGTAERLAEANRLSMTGEK